MKILSLSLPLLLSVAMQGYVPLEISRLPTCSFCKDEPNGSEAAISAKVVGNELHISTTSFAICGATLSGPKIVELSSSATIQVNSTDVSPARHDSCAVVTQQEFSIVGLHSTTKTIYYVENGIVLGHVATP